jgi:hypothetical protein
MLEPEPPGTFRACPSLYSDCFTYTANIAVRMCLSVPFFNASLPPADLLQTANLICIDAITTECARLELFPLLLRWPDSKHRVKELI